MPVRTRLRCLFALLLPGLLMACATSSPTAPGRSYILVRHAEKAEGAGKDPSLSEAGRARAEALARRLAGMPLVAVYATQYARTQQTATPAAQAAGVAVTRYEAGVEPSAFAARLRDQHPRGAVLVVGHSDTVPALVAALCGCRTTPLREDQYDQLYRIEVTADGTRPLVVDTY